jgi:putative endonuclease
MPSEALAKEGRLVWYVYLLESDTIAGRRYIGVTTDLKRRLIEHNSGKSTHTSKFAPWRIVTYVAFSDQAKAASFERYLKSGSGHAFASRRLW